MHSMMVDDEDYKELAELCDKYGECQINWVSQGNCEILGKANWQNLCLLI